MAEGAREGHSSLLVALVVAGARGLSGLTVLVGARLSHFGQ